MPLLGTFYFSPLNVCFLLTKGCDKITLDINLNYVTVC